MLNAESLSLLADVAPFLAAVLLGGIAITIAVWWAMPRR